MTSIAVVRIVFAMTKLIGIMTDQCFSAGDRLYETGHGIKRIVSAKYKTLVQPFIVEVHGDSAGIGIPGNSACHSTPSSTTPAASTTSHTRYRHTPTPTHGGVTCADLSHTKVLLVDII